MVQLQVGKTYIDYEENRYLIISDRGLGTYKFIGQNPLTYDIKAFDAKGASYNSTCELIVEDPTAVEMVALIHEGLAALKDKTTAIRRQQLASRSYKKKLVNMLCGKKN